MLANCMLVLSCVATAEVKNDGSESCVNDAECYCSLTRTSQGRMRCRAVSAACYRFNATWPWLTSATILFCKRQLVRYEVALQSPRDL
jgi:hypothetical protein